MAVGEGSTEPGDGERPQSHEIEPSETVPVAQSKQDESDEGEDNDEGNDDEEEDEEDEEEPRLKYATLTKSLNTLYRGGDACSTFMVVGDKMIAGTHNGSIHILTLPSLTTLVSYKAHTASVTSISVSPFPPPIATLRPDISQQTTGDASEGATKKAPDSPRGKPSPRPPVPNTPSNQIHIATSSIDGNVFAFSLVDAKDKQLRQFGRPVHSVALSPEYRSDRSYLSGGKEGNLILTSGGQTGKTASATTTGVSGAASGWLGAIGLGSNSGTDKILHSGEGSISAIKWSLSSKYVLWVNEQGIKITRTNLKLNSSDSSFEWKRIGHIDRPSRKGWEEMAGVWKARAEWIDRRNLESDENSVLERSSVSNGKEGLLDLQKSKNEDAVVGWGDTIWIIRIYGDDNTSPEATKEQRMGRAEVVTMVRFDDCIISGVSLYTPNLLLVLGYMEKKESTKKTESGKKGRSMRHNALEPELRLVDINTKEEVDSDTLTMSRFETLAASDYHLGVLSPIKIPTNLPKGYLSVIGSGVTSGVTAIGSGIGTVGSGIYTGVETVGQGVWDATMYGPRMLGANRIFSGADSIRSGKIGSDKAGSVKATNYLTGWLPGFGSSTMQTEEIADVATSQGLKIFIFSPYDCIVAVKRNLSDRWQWLTKMHRYQEAWELLDQHPEAAGIISESQSSSPPTPSKASSVARSGTDLRPSAADKQQATLAEFFADSISISSSIPARKGERFSQAEKEKRRIGESWLLELTKAEKWAEAGEVAGKVLNTTTRWEHWIWVFIKNKKFDEISPFIPTFQLVPPLPSPIFEIVLGHYAGEDRMRFKELLDQWPSDIFEISTITAEITQQLQSDTAPKGSNDWRILQESLAKLSVADGHFEEALKCYILLQDADTAMTLFKEHHLVDTIIDDIPDFVLLRIPSAQLEANNKEELRDLSSEAITLLVDEANNGTIEIDEVVSQLQTAKLPLFLYFYFRGLWLGEGSTNKESAPRVGHSAAISSLAADEGKLLVERFADTAVDLFSTYDRPLLMDFLQISTSYTFETAVKVCEKKHFIPELVYLLSKTGQMKKALFLIIDELGDVSKAIEFAKEQDDKGLWDDFLEYAMSRPKFISGLLAEVGTAIDPITLVKRIPEGLEIEGLREGLKKMIREYDLQDSISRGVATVLSSEVAVSMDQLRRGRRKGIKFEVPVKRKYSRVSVSDHTQALDAQQRQQQQQKTNQAKPTPTSKTEKSQQSDKTALPVFPEISTDIFAYDDDEDGTAKSNDAEILPGHCAGCLQPFRTPNEVETIVSFGCGHVFHVSHLFAPDPSKMGDNDNEDGKDKEAGEEDLSPPDSDLNSFSRSVGPKVTNARLLKDRIEAAGGCRVCKARRESGRLKGDG